MKGFIAERNGDVNGIRKKSYAFVVWEGDKRMRKESVFADGAGVGTRVGTGRTCGVG